VHAGNVAEGLTTALRELLPAGHSQPSAQSHLPPLHGIVSFHLHVQHVRTVSHASSQLALGKRCLLGIMYLLARYAADLRFPTRNCSIKTDTMWLNMIRADLLLFTQLCSPLFPGAHCGEVAAIRAR
jgi:hypothetical protein